MEGDIVRPATADEPYVDEEAVRLKAEADARHDIQNADTVIEAARNWKRDTIAYLAKTMGTHDPELPDEAEGLRRSRAGFVDLCNALTDLDGPEPHEQPVLASFQSRGAILDPFVPGDNGDPDEDDDRLADLDEDSTDEVVEDL